MKTDSKPWYKQFWPWFIIAIPSSSVVMGVILITLAMDGKDSLVRKNWYKDGMAINQRLEKQHKARELGINAFITLQKDNGSLLIDVNNISKTQQPELLVDLMHPTLQEKDRALKLYLAPNQQYYTKLDSIPSGLFYVLIRTPDAPWELEGKINFSNPLSNQALTPNG